MRKILLVIAVFIFSIDSFSINSIEVDRFNLMFNYSESSDFIWKSSELTKPKIDSLELINSKHPIYYEARKHNFFVSDFYLLKVGLSQIFVLPPSSCGGRMVEITIHNKSIGMNSLKLKVVGLDTLGNIVKTDSIDINSNSKWNKKSLHIYFDNIQYFTIGIIGEGAIGPFPEKKEIPRLYLDRMSIAIDGKNINQIGEINNFSIWDDEVLNQKDVYLLKKNLPENFITEIGLNRKKVFAIGETVHGSKEINETVFQIAKNVIMNNKCKLILTEMSLAVSLKINLYLQGKLAENEIINIREEIRDNHIYLPAFMEFLLWLREYNKTIERKVLFFGLMDSYEFIEAPLYGYIFTFYNQENKKILLPLLEKLHKKKLKVALDFVTDNSEKLKQILDKDEFFFFKYALENLSKIETGEIQLNLDNYDYYMWLNAKNIISQYLNENESALIYAHYSHVKKKKGSHIDPTIAQMGFYLNGYYKDSYCVIGLTVGEGRITSREQMSNKFTTIDLDVTGSGSIEKVCLQQNHALFYYPSKKLLHNIYSIRDIRNKTSPFSKNEIFNCLKVNADGFIFIRNSNNFKDNYPYSDNYFWDKGIERAAFLKKEFVNQY